MELKVRDVDPVCIAKLDELARKKKMSRSAYVKTLLERFCVMEDFKTLEQNHNDFLLSLRNCVDKNTTVLEKIIFLMEDTAV